MKSPNSVTMWMKMRLSGRRSSRCLIVPVLVMTALVGFWNWTDYWYDWSKTSRTSCHLEAQPAAAVELKNGNSSRNSDADSIHHQQQEAYIRALGEPSSSQGFSCRQRRASRADVDTLDIFPNLNFQVGKREKKKKKQCEKSAATCFSS